MVRGSSYVSGTRVSESTSTCHLHNNLAPNELVSYFVKSTETCSIFSISSKVTVERSTRRMIVENFEGGCYPEPLLDHHLTAL